MGPADHFLVLTRAIDVGAVLDAEHGDEADHIINLVQDAEGPRRAEWTPVSPRCSQYVGG
jgi:hypothetical protein